MKIDSAARLAAIAHPDPIVRNTILETCLKFSQTDIRVTREAIKAIDDHGLEDAFDYAHSVCKLELDDPSADWLIDLMEQIDGTTYYGNNALAHLTGWFVAEAPSNKLETHRPRLAALPKNTQAFSPATIDQELESRSEFRSLGNDRLYQIIQDHLDTLPEDTSFEDVDIPRLARLIDHLGSGDQALEKAIFTNLQETLPDPDGEFLRTHWNFGIWVIAAGHLKIEEAVPTLLEGMVFDWDWLNEEIPRALAKIGSPTALRLTTDFCLNRIETFEDEDYDYVRSFLTGAFEKTESPLTAELAQTLLKKEPDQFTRVNLAVTIASQLDGESIHHALNVYNEYPNDPERGKLLGYFYTHAILSDSQPSELRQWKTKLDREREKYRQINQQGFTNDSMMASFMNDRLASSPSTPGNIIPITRTEKKIPRNAPCPCGSGKKYKRCCLK